MATSETAEMYSLHNLTANPHLWWEQTNPLPKYAISGGPPEVDLDLYVFSRISHLDISHQGLLAILFWKKMEKGLQSVSPTNLWSYDVTCSFTSSLVVTRVVTTIDWWITQKLNGEVALVNPFLGDPYLS